MGISSSLEDYLETILNLQKCDHEIRITDIADEMHVSKPSVNRAVNTLRSQGFLEHEKYGKLRLTNKGEQKAESIARRHAIIKTFLTDVLSVEEETAEQEACMIEHSIGQKTTERLSEFLDKTLK